MFTQLLLHLQGGKRTSGEWRRTVEQAIRRLERLRIGRDWYGLEDVKGDEKGTKIVLKKKNGTDSVEDTKMLQRAQGGRMRKEAEQRVKKCRFYVIIGCRKSHYYKVQKEKRKQRWENKREGGFYYAILLYFSFLFCELIAGRWVQRGVLLLWLMNSGYCAVNTSCTNDTNRSTRGITSWDCDFCCNLEMTIKCDADENQLRRLKGKEKKRHLTDVLAWEH